MGDNFSIQLPDAVSDLVNTPAFAAYTIEGRSRDQESRLAALTIEDLFPEGIQETDMANCCLSGLWLLHNFLDRSHDISQEIQSPEGSFWHAIMHRLEGDFWNSKYWYRKVGNHSAYQSVQPNWNPETYVDSCEAAGNTGTEIQQTAVAEWKALFQFCFLNAQKSSS